MVAVAVRADDWPGSPFFKTAFFPSADDCHRLHIVSGVTLPAGGINLVSRVHFVGWGKVVLIVFVGDGLAVAIGTAQICFSVGLSNRLILVVRMAYKAGSVFHFCRGGGMFSLDGPIQKQGGVFVND